MVLGGRQKGDHGAVLFYRSQDLKNWEFDRELTTEDAFGYMWECPDFFELSGEKILSVSPQGLTTEEDRFQNIYQSGYFILQDGEVKAESFREWDMGFDFYAPQTFEDVKGRRILIGWMGMPDADDDYTNPTASEEKWQHCLTVPREITVKNNMLYQWPVEELNTLRGDFKELTDKKTEAEADTWLFGVSACFSFVRENQIARLTLAVCSEETSVIRYGSRICAKSFAESKFCSNTRERTVFPVLTAVLAIEAAVLYPM